MSNQTKLINATNTICDVVKSTLGTKGRTVLFNTYNEDNRPDKPQTTKDGATAAKYIRSEDQVENLIIGMIREGAFRTMLSAGDGTTTTTILIQSLVLKGIELMNEGVSYYDVKNALDACLEDIITYLKNNTIDISNDLSILERVASISANDEKIGKYIYSLIQDIGIHTNIEVKESFLSETSVEKVKGMRWYRGWYEKFMINNHKKETFEATDVHILIFNGAINTVECYAKYTNYLQGRPLVIFCKEISEMCIDVIRTQMHSLSAPLCFIEHDGYGERTEILLNDLAAVTGGFVIDVNDPYNPENLGFAKSVIAKQFSTSITFDLSENEENQNIISYLVEEIRGKLESDSLKNNTELSNNERKFHEKRLANMIGGIAVISVGGRTQIEMRELKDRFDDAVLAIQAAIKEGVFYGGGYALLNCQKHLDKTKKKFKGNIDAYELLQKSIEAPFKQLLINSDMFYFYTEYKNNIQRKKGLDLRTGKFYKLGDYKVYDSTQVLTDAVTNAVSVAKSLLSIKEMMYDGIRSVN